MTQREARPTLIYLLLALIFFQGVSGIFGGIGLVLDPSGRALQIPLKWLAGSPFGNYLIPGIILLLVLGIYPLVVFYGLFRRLPWSWPAALLLGIALLIWIGVEILVIGYQPQPPLQLIYGVVGGLILVVALLPVVRGFYS